MKKIILSLVLICASVFGANGGFVENEANKMQKGGFVDTTKSSKMSVREALNAKDDSRAILQGKIVREIKHEKYLFSDGQNNIIADIDDDVWLGLTITPNDLIEIEGYIDNDAFERTEVEVKRIKKLQ